MGQDCATPQDSVCDLPGASSNSVAMAPVQALFSGVVGMAVGLDKRDLRAQPRHSSVLQQSNAKHNYVDRARPVYAGHSPVMALMQAVL